ncbi:unnamed protein product [Sphenostylis stenocarpa]|uniref:Uncharacterized protein n=1 Tax=Sphenostylis stenocarpa TaxID=92480 RepID=A0AA86TQF5_9FABA|nr:unnamed protein product [Sphenostylis stenocarpa]
MDSGTCLLSLLVVLPTVSHIRSEPILRLSSEKVILSDYCDNWRLAVETNNARERVPTNCVNFVAEYMIEGQYWRDCDVVGNLSLAFTRSVKLVEDGRDAWVFDEIRHFSPTYLTKKKLDSDLRSSMRLPSIIG